MQRKKEKVRGGGKSGALNLLLCANFEERFDYKGLLYADLSCISAKSCFRGLKILGNKLYKIEKLFLKILGSTQITIITYTIKFHK